MISCQITCQGYDKSTKKTRVLCQPFFSHTFLIVLYKKKSIQQQNILKTHMLYCLTFIMMLMSISRHRNKNYGELAVFACRFSLSIAKNHLICTLHWDENSYLVL